MTTKQKVSDINASATFRKAMAIILYVFFMVWIIYSNSKKTIKSSNTVDKIGQTAFSK